MSLAKFITAHTKEIAAEWEEFARECYPEASIEQHRDHVVGMLRAIAVDLAKPQTAHEQEEKSKGNDDAHPDRDTAANAHGTDRAADGYTPVQMVAEFRALRASVLRLWSKSKTEFNRANLQDVTRFNEAIDQLLAESITKYAQDVGNAKDLFIGVLGHDLRNPLGAIMMSATLMIRKEGPDWRHAKTASRILNSGTRMEAMISDLLDFTRGRLGGGIPVDPAEMDLQEVCRQTVDEITAFHPECIVHFEASGQLRGEWDSRRIAQALSNLIGNAYQHGAENEPVEVVVRGEAEQVVLTVHNQGAAIPSTQLRDIFNPFRQLAPSHKRTKKLGSVGLGLYIVQSIVLAHHGTIGVESTKKGTTFKVCLPRSAPAAMAAKQPSPAS